VAAALTAWGGFLLASAAGLASHTGGHTPVDEERSFPTPDWLLPFALAVLAVGVVGFVLAILFLAPKVDESDLVFRDPPWIAKVVFVGLVYAAPIFVGLAATESAQRWVPLALNLICTPLCLVVIWTNDAGGRRELTDDELLDRWGSEPDPRGERFRGRAERADGA
jgi:quinol-cytochrome oxidoreductase complex cytochrome b subunit